MKFEYLGYEVDINLELDPFMGPPWKEHDGHGPVSDWTTREKRPGEKILSSRPGSARRYYDYDAATAQAKTESWGLNEDATKKLETRLGKAPTAAQIAKETVDYDFKYLKDWCDNKWNWWRYSTTITDANGKTSRGDSCGGFDDYAYAKQEAEDSARSHINELIKLNEQTMLAEAWP